MKKLALLCTLLLATPVFAGGILWSKPYSISKTVASTSTPEPIAATTTLANSVVIQAKSSNTLPVTIGSSSAQDVALVAGEELVLREQRQPYDLSSIYVDVGLNGNGVNVFYTRISSE